LRFEFPRTDGGGNEMAVDVIEEGRPCRSRS
jgi:hypothetical protein